MKNIAVYSGDSNICLSLLIYLQNEYNVTTTTNFNILKDITNCIKFDLIIIDSEPTKSIETFCKETNEQHPCTPIVFTYVFKNNNKVIEKNLRKYTNSIFYKPVDLYEISKHLESLLA